MAVFKQIGAVVGMGLRSLPQRRGSSLVVVLGIAGVVAVLISVMSLSDGLTRTLASTGRPDRAIVINRGGNSEIDSAVPRDAIHTIEESSAVARDSDGKPVASAEGLVSGSLPLQGRDALGNISFRGVSAGARSLRPEVVVVEGRWFRTGVNEIVVGRAAQARFKGLKVGNRVQFGEDLWTVVGAYTSGGDARESELETDAETLLSAYQRAAFSSVTVKLRGPGEFTAFRAGLIADPSLSVEVVRESDYYTQQSGRFAKLLSLVAQVVGAIMALGAVFGALNTMYSSVSARTVEIATLRAIGYGSFAIVASVLAEALLLSLLGAICGAALAWFAFNGDTVSTVSGGASYAQVVFQLRVGFGLVALGVLWACAVGLVGGLLPALRAARIPVATALRAM